MCNDALVQILIMEMLIDTVTHFSSVIFTFGGWGHLSALSSDVVGVPGEHLLAQECCTFAPSAVRQENVPGMCIDAFECRRLVEHVYSSATVDREQMHS